MDELSRWMLALSVMLAACATGVSGDDTENEDGSSAQAGGGTDGVGGHTAGPGSTSSAAVGGSSTTTSSGNGGAVSSSVSTTSVASSTSTSATTTTSGGCTPVDVISDGGLEAGPGSGNWVESSSNFGTPICDVAGCGAGGGTGPYAGLYWAWFGGHPYGSEIAEIEQTVTIPSASMATLEFQLEIPVCDSSFDWFDVVIDNQNVVFSTDGADPMCGQMGYQLKTVDVSLFADGSAHTVAFIANTSSFNFGATNFMVDDIKLTACP